jgi:hypothetical protein
MVTRPLTWEVCHPKKQFSCCICWGDRTANYRGCSRWNYTGAAVAKRSRAERGLRMASLSARLHWKRFVLSNILNWTEWARDGTALSERAAGVKTLAVICRWKPTRTVPNTPIQPFPPHSPPEKVDDIQNFRAKASTTNASVPFVSRVIYFAVSRTCASSSDHASSCWPVCSLSVGTAVKG